METGIIIAALALVVAIAALALFFWQKTRIDSVLKPDGKDLEDALKKLRGLFEESKKAQESAEEVVKKYVEKSKSSVQKVGFKKYDAYEDAGGQQSFVAVLLDAENNGILINCMHGRDSTRVYGKEVKGGRVETTLSAEEQSILNSAV